MSSSGLPSGTPSSGATSAGAPTARTVSAVRTTDSPKPCWYRW